MPEQDRGPCLVKDPHLPWDGAFPYDHLDARLRQVGRPGLGPSATAHEIKDVFFHLMAGATPEDRRAWDELRRLDRRLVLDFFLYRLEGAELDAWEEARGKCEP